MAWRWDQGYAKHRLNGMRTPTRDNTFCDTAKKAIPIGPLCDARHIGVARYIGFDLVGGRNPVCGSGL